MKIDAREIKSFLYSQYFSDGLRMTAGILFPSLILSWFHHFGQGIMMSLGALCIATIDSPGPLWHKRNGMVAGNICLFVVAITTGFARFNVFTLGFEILAFSFVFSMFTVYGNRAASVGTAALLIMILMMDEDVKPSAVLVVSLIILAGGIWYLLFSLAFFGIRPYRAAQQTLGENVSGIADFLRIKADFYLPETDIDENYLKLVAQQVKVSQQQDAVREQLFKSRLMVKESTRESRRLVLTFIDLVDMFGQIMATDYDYEKIRANFAATGILNEIAALLKSMANAVDNIAYMVLSNTRNKYQRDFITELEQLKWRIDQLGLNKESPGNLALKKILISLRDLNDRIKSTNYYYNNASPETLPEETLGRDDYSKFVTSQDYAPSVFFDNFSLQSSAFKHALRVSLVCLIGFILGRTVAIGHHSYWIVLTIIVILKPGFSLSRQRNYQRLIGTIAGGFIGIAILLFIPDKTLQFLILVFFMIGAYSFLRFNYVVSVIFITPYVLIIFNFLGVGLVVKERILDTIIGSGIAFIASYLVFPSWEYEQINSNLAGVINANVSYLVTVANSILGKDPGEIEYKLARKDVFVKSANLSAAFERMTSEPKSKQWKIKEIHKFVVLNHILSSYIATIASAISSKSPDKNQAGNFKIIKRSISALNVSSKKLGGKTAGFNTGKTVPAPALTVQNRDSGDILLKEQLGFVNKISKDIARVTENIMN